MNENRLSVIIITKDEQDNIKDCLESVKWADEIIVVDSGSTDQTEAICREYTDKFYVRDWPGFGVQKQRALELATYDWVLSIDADERVTPELQKEIESIINVDPIRSGYQIPRLSYYLGKGIRHAGWYPDYILRLVQRSRAHFSEDIVHERLVVDGGVDRLSSHFMHFPHKDIAHHFQKINQYSSLSAEKMFKEGRSTNWIAIFAKPVFGFFRAYVLRKGFLDGWHGLAVSVSTSMLIYLKYIKLKERQRKK